MVVGLEEQGLIHPSKTCQVGRKGEGREEEEEGEICRCLGLISVIHTPTMIIMEEEEGEGNGIKRYKEHMQNEHMTQKGKDV